MQRCYLAMVGSISVVVNLAKYEVSKKIVKKILEYLSFKTT